jgi:hypothetical protein
MKILRIFIKPAGVSLCDVPLGDGHPTMAALWDSWKRDGAATHDNPDFIIPWESILYTAVYTIPDELLKNANEPIPFKAPTLVPSAS